MKTTVHCLLQCLKSLFFKIGTFAEKHVYIPRFVVSVSHMPIIYSDQDVWPGVYNVLHRIFNMPVS